MFRISKQFYESLLLLLLLDDLDDGSFHKSRELAKMLEASQVSLVKTLRLLVIAGMVESSSSKIGGFRLAQPLDQITLADVIVAITQGGRFPSPAENLLASMNNRINQRLSLNQVCLWNIFQRCTQAALNELAKITVSNLRGPASEERLQLVLPVRHIRP